MECVCVVFFFARCSLISSSGAWIEAMAMAAGPATCPEGLIFFFFLFIHSQTIRRTARHVLGCDVGVEAHCESSAAMESTVAATCKGYVVLQWYVVLLSSLHVVSVAFVYHRAAKEKRRKNESTAEQVIVFRAVRGDDVARTVVQ